MLRSLKGVYKASSVGAWLGLGPSPDPGPGAGVELGGGHLGGAGGLAGSATSCPASAQRRKIRHQSSCRLSQQAPLGMKACRMRMAFQPGPDALAVVAGEDNR